MDHQEIPTLMTFLFGERASLALEGASERMLRWCRAFDEWLAERRRENHNSTYRHSLKMWEKLLGRVKKTPWEITQGDMKSYVEWLQE